MARQETDVVLMDIRMPRMNGLEAAARILAEDGDREPPRVVVLTTFDLDEYVFAALETGCSGFLLKDAPRADVVAAVRAAAAGEALIAPAVTRRVIEEFARRPSAVEPVAAPVDPRLATLTDREREVLEQMARGLSNQEIADRLVVAPGTVKTHVARILMKLGLRDRVQAVVLAYEQGLVRPGAEG